MRLKIEDPSTYDLDSWRDIKLTPLPSFLYELGNYEPHHEKPTFCLYKCENEVADQKRGTCNCVSDQRLRYRDNINASDPEDSFFRNAAHIQL